MQPHLVVVNIALQRADGNVLLFERIGTETSVGKFVVPGGRVDPGESLAEAAVREVKEEIGVTISPESLEFAGLFDRPGLDKAPFRTLQFFYVVKDWEGEPANMEPEKHGEVGWYETDKLPAATHPLDRAVIERNFKPDIVTM